MRHPARLVIPAFALLLGAACPSAWGQGDPAVLERIVAEGKNHSQVMSYLEHLSLDIGPRLTGSSRLDFANAWTRDQFAALGLHAWMQKWGEIPVRFDRGPSTARMVEPAESEFEFTARAWSAGTDGSVRGTVVKLPETIEAFDELETAGAFDGAWVLSKAPSRFRRGRRGGGGDNAERDAARALREEIDARLESVAIAGRIYGGRNELALTGGERNWRELDYGALPTDVAITVRRSDYDAMNSRLADGEDVEVEVDLQHHFVEGPIPLYNTVAEIRGTDWPDEVVIVSGHLDSWDGPGSTGTQDNGTGCSVALEAARLLMAADARPRRTIRFILWTGEEQGLLGSSAYLDGLSEGERDLISAVLVDDGGGGYCGGLECIESMTPMLSQAVAEANEAFPDMPVELEVRERMPRGGGSDHVPFNRAGIPGFFWVESGLGGQEGKDYRFIHHTQHDTLRYVVPEQLVQSAVASAVVAYNLACADTLLPREAQEEPSSPIAERERRREPAATGASRSASADETAAAASAPSASAAEPAAAWAALSGRWTAQLIGEEMPPDSGFAIIFLPEGDTLHGTVESAMGGGELKDVQFDAAEHALSFTVETENGGEIVTVASVEGDTMQGTLRFREDFSIGFRAKRETDL